MITTLGYAFGFVATGLGLAKWFSDYQKGKNPGIGTFIICCIPAAIALYLLFLFPKAAG